MHGHCNCFYCVSPRVYRILGKDIRANGAKEVSIRAGYMIKNDSMQKSKKANINEK